MTQSGIYSRYGKNMETNADGNVVMTVKDVCKKLKCSQTMVYNMIGSGKLPAFRLGCRKGIRVNSREVDRIMAELIDDDALEE